MVKPVVELVYVGGRSEDIARYARMSRGVKEEAIVEEDAKLLKKLFEWGHWEPFEFLEMVFYVECSLVASRQIARHRIGVSKVERSLRYVVLDTMQFYSFLPPDAPEWEDIEKFFAQARDLYHMLSKKYPQELARYVLPMATTTKLYISFNARSLYHFLEVRLDKYAQPELQEIAGLMLDALLNHEETALLGKLFQEKLTQEVTV